MRKQTIQFGVQKDKNNVVQKIGKSVMYHPKIKYDGRKTKWFDDSDLVKGAKK